MNGKRKSHIHCIRKESVRGTGGWGPVRSKHRFSLGVENKCGRTRDGMAEPKEREQGKFGYFPCLADHEEDWQPYPTDAQSAERDGHKIHKRTNVCSKHQKYISLSATKLPHIQKILLISNRFFLVYIVNRIISHFILQINLATAYARTILYNQGSRGL